MEISSRLPEHREGTAYTIVMGKPLSPRERETLFYTALGCTAEQIGDRMFITKDTAKNHRGNAYVKLGAYTGVEAIALMMVTDHEFYDSVKEAVLMTGSHNAQYERVTMPENLNPSENIEDIDAVVKAYLELAGVTSIQRLNKKKLYGIITAAYVQGYGAAVIDVEKGKNSDQRKQAH